jgi:hypothetical protein
MVVRQAGITQKLGSLVLYTIATVNSLGAATYKSAMDIDNILAPGNKVEDYGVRGVYVKATTRMKAMNDISTVDLTDEMDLSYDVSDEALEMLAGSVREKAAAFTLAFCSGLDTCPA